MHLSHTHITPYRSRNVYTLTPKWCAAVHEPDSPWVQYIPRNMHTVFALLCFVVVIHWLIFPYPSGLLRWHCGNLTIAPVPAKQPWWIWINTSCEFIMHNHNKAKHNKTVCIFLGIYCMSPQRSPSGPPHRIQYPSFYQIHCVQLGYRAC